MKPHAQRDLAVARERARAAAQRAASAFERAEQYDRIAHTGPWPTRNLYLELADLQRRVAEHHRAASELQSAYAARLVAYTAVEQAGQPPPFIDAVADAIGVESAAVLLVGEGRRVCAAVATDTRSWAAQDIELITGEGPAAEAMDTRSFVVAAEDELAQRWPHYALAVAELGVREVASAPIRGPNGPVGALTVFDAPWTFERRRRQVFTSVADALGESVLSGGLVQDVEVLDRPLLRDDELRLVHNAAGVVAETAGCDVRDALLLVRARAYTEGVDSVSIARRIVDRELTLHI